MCKGCYYQEQIPAIGSDGTIYAGGARGLYALRPDGTQKWYYENVYQPSGIPIHFVVIDDNENIWFDGTSTIPGSGSVIRVGPEGQDEGGMGLGGGPPTQIGEAFDGTIVASGTALDITGKSAQPKSWIVGGNSSRSRRTAPFTPLVQISWLNRPIIVSPGQKKFPRLANLS